MGNDKRQLRDDENKIEWCLREPAYVQSIIDAGVVDNLDTLKRAMSLAYPKNERDRLLGRSYISDPGQLAMYDAKNKPM